ncbi:Butyrophilin subfamily 2 member A2 [Acipenser ruthenus]|uniref:Butyrophilin subfamily 2 member A2 n=1 Tax=Acipenser ruthenus TaxID=7906 RepID=A0A444UCR3_ACIRT|nr:Butyrophilin subfamily 2 member A2 [Acipenser ruthenus]
MKQWMLLLCFSVLHSTAEATSLKTSDSPVKGMLSEEVSLPCSISPISDATPLNISWLKKPNDLLVYSYHLGSSRAGSSFEGGRANIDLSKLTRGDLTLTLLNLTFADEGTYLCQTTDSKREKVEKTVELEVWSVGQRPLILLSSLPTALSISLSCQSSGWAPAPQVSWIGGDGSLLGRGESEAMGQGKPIKVINKVTINAKDEQKVSCSLRNTLLDKEMRETVIITGETKGGKQREREREGPDLHTEQHTAGERDIQDNITGETEGGRERVRGREKQREREREGPNLHTEQHTAGERDIQDNITGETEGGRERVRGREKQREREREGPNLHTEQHTAGERDIQDNITGETEGGRERVRGRGKQREREREGPNLHTEQHTPGERDIQDNITGDFPPSVSPWLIVFIVLLLILGVIAGVVFWQYSKKREAIRVKERQAAEAEREPLLEQYEYDKLKSELSAPGMKEGFSSGNPYWEVAVREKDWTVGVIEDGMDIKTMVGGKEGSSACPEKGVCALSMKGSSELRALLSSPFPITPSEPPRKLGFLLDWEEKQLSVYDAERKQRLYTFNTAFKNKVVPFCL